MPTDADWKCTMRHDGRGARQNGDLTVSISVMGWDDVGQFVRQARSLRRQTQAEFAREVGLSVRIIGALESGESRRYDATTVDRIESALGWEHGSVARVVEGGKPTVKVDQHLARILDVWPKLPVEVRRILADQAATAVRDDGHEQ